MVDGGRLGVLDFETAETAGLPGHDLVFACAYIATVSAKRPDPQLAGQAFHGPDAWAATVVAAHLRRLGIAPELDAALSPWPAVAWSPRRSPTPSRSPQTAATPRRATSLCGAARSARCPRPVPA